MSDWGEVVRNYELGLYSMVAPVLTGRRVKIEFRDLYLDGVRGIAARDGDIGIIQIKPGMDPRQTVKTFLHECGHVREDWYLLDRSGDHERAPGSVDLADIPRADLIPEDRERSANSWSAYWLNYAEDHARNPNSVISLLTVLLGWEEVK